MASAKDLFGNVVAPVPNVPVNLKKQYRTSREMFYQYSQEIQRGAAHRAVQKEMDEYLARVKR